MKLFVCCMQWPMMLGLSGATVMAVLVMPVTIAVACGLFVYYDRQRHRARTAKLQALAEALGIRYVEPDARDVPALLEKIGDWLEALMSTDGSDASAGHILTGQIDGIELLAFDWRVTDRSGTGPDHHQTMLLMRDAAVDLPPFHLRPYNRFVSLLEGDDFAMPEIVAGDPEGNEHLTAADTLERLFQQHNRIDADDPLEVQHHLGPAVRGMLANNRELHVVGAGPLLAIFRMHRKDSPAQLQERLTDGLAMIAMLREQAAMMDDRSSHGGD